MVDSVNVKNEATGVALGLKLLASGSHAQSAWLENTSINTTENVKETFMLGGWSNVAMGFSATSGCGIKNLHTAPIIITKAILGTITLTATGRLVSLNRCSASTGAVLSTATGLTPAPSLAPRRGNNLAGVIPSAALVDTAPLTVTQMLSVYNVWFSSIGVASSTSTTRPTDPDFNWAGSGILLAPNEILAWKYESNTTAVPAVVVGSFSMNFEYILA